ncbi:paxillin isoform X2 [Brachionus plicatilis]|uniref:Paxillin isoform X2 n=1 Tax=Brachionus plicatilis TaxID=10195 RepID=A0A3M7QAH2_BRAPC|nr:paxillin isoform X2 [Brachionus plicatilis]
MNKNFIDKLNDFKNGHRAFSYLSDSSESVSDRHELVELDNLLEDLYHAKQTLSESNTSTSSGSSPAVSSPNSVVFRRQPPPNSITDAEKELQNLMTSLCKYKSNSRLDTDKNVCSKCKEPIVGQVITALGCLWHPEHFVCTHCHRSIGTSIFYEKDHKPYCEQDYFELFSPKCAACSHSIKDVNFF